MVWHILSYFYSISNIGKEVCGVLDSFFSFLKKFDKRKAHNVLALINTPPNYLLGSTTSPRMKTTEGEGVWAHSLAHNTSKVEGHVGAPGWD
jgi:hypothetical protein